MRSVLIFLSNFSSERGLDILFLSSGAVSESLGSKHRMSLDSPAIFPHPLIPFHSSAFSEVASFPFSSLLAYFLSVEACPSFSAPVACAKKGHAPLVSAGVRGELQGMARLQMTLFDPLLPGVSRQGSKDLSWHKSFLGWTGEALCSVPDEILPILEKQSSRLLTISFWNLKTLLNTKVMENFL